MWSFATPTTIWPAGRAKSKVSAVVLDIDTQGDDPYGGLPVLTELRSLNNDFTLISMSRARARSVEKQALQRRRRCPLPQPG